jgi:hypothetical protein
MVQRQLIRRAAASSASCAIALVLCATSASAKDNKKAICTVALTAYKHGVEANKGGHVREARSSFAACAEATACGGLVPKCRALYDRLGADMPSVVPIVTDENGAPRVDVEVKVDGELLTSQLDGRGLPVEAGLHEFVFSTDRGVFATEKVMIAEGQRNRPLAVTMGGAKVASVAAGTVPSQPVAAEAKAAPEGDKATPQKTTTEDEVRSTGRGERSGGGDWAMPRSVFPYVLGGVGLAGVAAGGLLTFWGNKDNTDLQTSCSPTCRPSSVNHIKTMYIAADISFGVGAAALAVTTFLFATSRSTESAARPPSHEALSVDVQPTKSGAFASVSGAF